MSYVVFSAGAHRGFGHPHQETIDQIRRVNPKTRLVCTNICRRLLQQREEGLRYLKDGATIDSLLEINVVSRQGYRPDTRYHGTTRFDIHDDGTIELNTECNPMITCENHRV